jgi:DNA-binding transcriptional MerR regulator
MKIHELAHRTSLTAPTIRFYEQEGLLDARHVQRGENNYRDYCEETVKHLLLLKKLQSVGFTLAEFKELTQLDETNALTQQKKVRFLRQKMEEIDRKQAELEQIQADLAEMLARKLAKIKANGIEVDIPMLVV